MSRKRRFGRGASGANSGSAATEPHLIVVRGQAPDDAFKVPQGRSYVGRGPDNDIVLASQSVSRIHARLVCRGSRVTVEDLGSRNGTWVGGARADRPVELTAGDTVRMGDVLLRLSLFPAGASPVAGRGRSGPLPAAGAGQPFEDAPTVPSQRAVPAAEDLPPGGAVRRRPARRRRRRPETRRAPWWKDLTNRAKAAILTLGALAAAISAILALRPGPDAADYAEIRSVDLVLSRLPLSKFDVEPVVFVPSSARAGSAGADGISPVALHLDLSLDDGSATPGASPPASEPGQATESASGGETGAASETTSSAPGSPTTTPTGPETPTSSPAGPSDSPVSPSVSVPPMSMTDVRHLVGDRARRFYFPIPADDAEQAALDPTMQIARQAALGAQASPVSAEQAARRIVKFLGQVRTAHVKTRHGVKKDPVGAEVVVKLDLSGLRDKPVLLDWQLVRPAASRLPYDGWLRRVQAYELRTRSERASTSVFMWVPLPKAPGPYVVIVSATSGGTLLDTSKSVPFR